VATVGRETLRALVSGLVTQLNTLIVGATVEELHDILAALAASQGHVIAQLLAANDVRADSRKAPEYYDARQVAAITGYSRSWLYENGERLGIAVRPRGAPGLRFPKFAVEVWMERRDREV
jgi:hypothetical protein